MNNIDSTVFIYAKDGKIKVIGLQNARKASDELKKEGWTHTATLDPCMFLEYLVNKANDADILKEIKEFPYCVKIQ